MQTDDDGRTAELSNEIRAMTAAQAKLDAINAKLDGASGLSRKQAEAIRAEVAVARANFDRASKGGGKLSRSETVTVRLDPKLRYLAELAARLHRRTLSSYIEWSIKESIDAEPLRPHGLSAEDAVAITIGTQAENLWDVDEPDRFAKLALRYPHLLTHEEQVKWKLICENGYLWKGSYRSGEWDWSPDEGKLLVDRLRDNWELFCAVANGDKPASELPTWAKSNRPVPKASTSTGFDDTDDGIPF